MANARLSLVSHVSHPVPHCFPTKTFSFPVAGASKRSKQLVNAAVAAVAIGSKISSDASVSPPASVPKQPLKSKPFKALFPQNNLHSLASETLPRFEASHNRSGTSESISSQLGTIRRGTETYVNNSPLLSASGTSSNNSLGASSVKSKNASYDSSHYQTSNPFSTKPPALPLSLSVSDSLETRSYGRSSSSAYDFSASSSSSSSSSRLHFTDLPPGFPNVGNTCYMCVFIYLYPSSYGSACSDQKPSIPVLFPQSFRVPGILCCNACSILQAFQSRCARRI